MESKVELARERDRNQADVMWWCGWCWAEKEAESCAALPCRQAAVADEADGLHHLMASTRAVVVFVRKGNGGRGVAVSWPGRGVLSWPAVEWNGSPGAELEWRQGLIRRCGRDDVGRRTGGQATCSEKLEAIAGLQNEQTGEMAAARAGQGESKVGLRGHVGGEEWKEVDEPRWGG